MANQEPQITICSVYHSDMSKRILEMNTAFIRALNPDASFVHFAANNSPDGSIHIGKDFKEFPRGPMPEFAPKHSWTGFDYGTSMNSLLPHVKTRFVLFLDYDFFVVRPNWIAEVIAYMKEHQLGILGAPYHPKYWVKFRYFPAIYCLFVDREKIGPEFTDWNFMPLYSPQELAKSDVAKERQVAHKKTHPPSSRLRKFIEVVKKRRYIGQSKDICYDLHRRYNGKGIVHVECFQPAVIVDHFAYHYPVNPRWYPLLYQLEKLIPERWSFVPKKKDFFTFTHFKDQGAFDVMGRGMEEYFWRGKPLGLHVRGFKERWLKASGKEFDPEETIDLLREATESFSSPADGSRS